MTLLSPETLDPRTSVLNASQVELMAALLPCMETVRFPAGEPVFMAGSPADAFYIVDGGEARVELASDEPDTDAVLEYVGPGAFLGEVAVLAGNARSVSAYAHTDMTVRKVSARGLRRLFDDDPAQGILVIRALARNTALKLEGALEQLAEHVPNDGLDSEVERMVADGNAAQEVFASWPEDRVDALLTEIAETVAARAQELAELELAETHIGNATDKALKAQFASLGVLASLVGRTGAGPLGDDPERRVAEVASAAGLVLALVPLTNPVPTFVNKTLICLKSRNAVIFSCHRRALGSGEAIGTLIEEVLAAHGAPANLVQWVRNRTSRKKTARFMRHPGVALILATGGPAMVSAAYSSGKPALGVGPGNAPAWIAADADVDAAAKAVVDSKAFDNGLICGAEQHLVVDTAVYGAVVEALGRHGAAVLTEEQTQTFVTCAFEENGDLRMHLVGQSAPVIAAVAGLEVPPGTRLLVFRADTANVAGASARERLAPVLSLFGVDGDDAAIDVCRRLLAYEGAGHTANIHTADEARVERFTREMPVGRILVNAPSAMGCCGVVTGLTPSLTIGCGTFGGNSTTDNVSYGNLMNVKRVARVLG